MRWMFGAAFAAGLFVSQSALALTESGTFWGYYGGTFNLSAEAEGVSKTFYVKFETDASLVDYDMEFHETAGFYDILPNGNYDESLVSDRELLFGGTYSPALHGFYAKFTTYQARSPYTDPAWPGYTFGYVADDPYVFLLTNTDPNIPSRLYNYTLTIAEVPEPATWALLILGAGMIGFGARRRNVGSALAA